MKKILALLLSLCLIFSLSVNVFAAEEQAKTVLDKVEINKVDIKSKTRTLNKSITEKALLNRIEQLEELKNDQCKMEKAKKAVTDFINSPDFYKQTTINDKDSVLNSIINKDPQQSYRSQGTFLYSEWIVTPYHLSTYYNTNYGSWISVNAYCISIPIAVTSTLTSSCTVTLGLQGSISLSEVIEFGLEGSAVSSKTNSTSYSVGFTVPAWTKIAKCAKTRTQNKAYYGLKRNYYLTGLYTVVSEDEHVASVNTTILEESMEFWQAINQSRNPNATPPNPPIY